MVQIKLFLDPVSS